MRLADWAEDTIAPENIDYSKFDILLYGALLHPLLVLHLSRRDLSPQLRYSVPAFATPNSSSTLTWDSGSQALLQRLVSSANSSGAGTKIVLSVGGASRAIISRLRLCDLEEFVNNLFVYIFDRVERVVLVQVRRREHEQTHLTYSSLLFHGHSHSQPRCDV